MCGIWKMSAKYRDSELSLDQFDRVFADPLFRSIELFNINGGEPNLREDLVDITRAALARLPRLQAVSLNSNGIPAARTIANVDAIAALCRDRGVRFSVSLSLHALGEEFDRIAGSHGAFAHVDESFRGLRGMRDARGFFLSANCVITGLNVRYLDRVLAWGQEETIPVSFVLGEVRDRFNNASMEDDVTLGPHERPLAVSFLRRLSESRGVHVQHAFRYRELANMLEHGRARRLACHYLMGGVILGSDGQLYYCKHSGPIGNSLDRSAEEIYLDADNLRYRSRDIQGRICPVCLPNTYNRMEVEKDLLMVGRFLCLGR
jgi:MoaA/NifB/PqqE/SkfB family radical SAM enzyme